MPTIGVIGVGSIGSVLAAGFRELGFTVIINDTDLEAMIDSPHPGASKQEMTGDADLIVIAVPTPTTRHGGDVSAVQSVLREIQDTGAPVVLRSTMPPGSTAALRDQFNMPLVYSPEFLRDRSDVNDFFKQDRIVLAGPRVQRNRVRPFLAHDEIEYGQLIETEDYLTAELGKYAHNAFFATKVSFANQMRIISERGGADPEVVMDIVTADSRNTSSHLNPMLGPFGGKCLPKDLEALTHFTHEDIQAPAHLLEAVWTVNQLAKEEYDEFDIRGNYPNLEVVEPSD